MPRMIFISLPVSDVARATAFYEAIGFTKNPAFSNDRSSCLIWSDAIYVMVMDREMFATLTPKRIVDANAETGTLFALSFDSRADVDAIAEAAVAAGGSEVHGAEDQGFMYSRAFADPDGNGWGPFHMDMAAAPEELREAATA
jgi:uncharacterized protein